MWNHQRLITLVCLITFVFPPSAYANLVEPTQIIEQHLPESIHLGHGTFKKFGFEIYQAHFFVDEMNAAKKFALNLNYARNIQKDALLKATIEQFEHLGYPPKKTEEWKIQLDQIYPNITKGDQITAIYHPISGTSFLHGNKFLGKITGNDFAEAFFGIWLSSKTSAPDLRSKLLSNNCPPLLFQTPSCH